MKEFYINGKFDAQQAIQNGKSITQVIEELLNDEKILLGRLGASRSLESEAMRKYYLTKDLSNNETI